MTTSPSEATAGPDPGPVHDAAGQADLAASVADLAVIGAGPAGLAAAVAAAERGLRVALIDAEPVAGGQFWRHPWVRAEPGVITDDGVAELHHDLATYRDLLDRLQILAESGWLVRRTRHEVWSVQRLAAEGARDTARFVVNAVLRERAGVIPVAIRARTVLLATGAYDLQVPFPGWDLPGVMTAGGVQSLLKGHGVPAGDRVVVAGTGPFLLSVASGLARSGVTVCGVYEAARPTRWLRELPSLGGSGPKIVEGAGYAKDLARHRIPYRTGWTVVRAEGSGRLETVTVAPLGPRGAAPADRSRTVPADVLAVGWGFVPQIDLAVGLGCETRPDPHGLPVVRVDAAGRTSVPGVYAAGEVSGVGGAGLAVVEGELAGIAIAGSADAGSAGAGVAVAGSADAGMAVAGSAIGADRARIGRLLRRRRSLRRFAAALHRSYPVPTSWIDLVSDDTIVCRCEDVTVAAIRSVVERDGVSDGRTVKLLARPGMGWCQGRICGYATERLARVRTGGGWADESGGSGPAPIPADERSVVVPIPLGLLAGAPAPAPSSAVPSVASSPEATAGTTLGGHPGPLGGHAGPLGGHAGPLGGHAGPPAAPDSSV